MDSKKDDVLIGSLGEVQVRGLEQVEIHSAERITLKTPRDIKLDSRNVKLSADEFCLKADSMKIEAGDRFRAKAKDVKIEASSGDVKAKASDDVTIEAGNDASLKAGDDLELKAGGDAKLKAKGALGLSAKGVKVSALEDVGAKLRVGLRLQGRGHQNGGGPARRHRR